MASTTKRSERRQRVAAALLRVVVAEGMDAASLRAVAAEAGMSLGMVQRLFDTKDELLLFTYRACLDAMAARITEAVEDRQGLPMLVMLRAALLAALPLDEQRRADWRYIIAFGERFGTRDDIAEMIAEDDARSYRDMLGLLQAAEALGQIPAGHDLPGAAHLLRLLSEGMTLSLLGGRDGSVAAVTSGLDAALELLRATPAGAGRPADTTPTD
ncbi:AcrR family transcriptional regulator [Actinoalloteichus hoggarensis]|uniref:Transcriptional regulator BetI n=1 Tax=Actinoalloteichus hoggarensis TaxID=1470176 RepID=A0A221W9E2_9PSEU|nr:TetR/AcrR family transcriptional regulator [Actinoalloteichus hoggarensis]ASO22628.1 transcriptional regulator BetI [Actinoalloteichus hoggarensis]MBB5924229.1 AcrR family transcriptional regulator [Actinoalloteichus hoggarensis]